jgi:RNA polymerase sigma-70 factor (family 1)
LHPVTGYRRQVTGDRSYNLRTVTTHIFPSLKSVIATSLKTGVIDLLREVVWRYRCRVETFYINSLTNHLNLIFVKDSQDTKSLLDRLSKNDEAAFREIFSQFSNQVYSFSLKLTRDQFTAEEMVQEIFLKIWLIRVNLYNIENLSSYLFIVTKNLVLNTLKRRLREERAKATFLRNAEKAKWDTEEKVIHNDYERILNETIQNLPPQQRLVYSMCHQEGLQYEEAAQKLKISRLTVKTHMHQARKSIRAQLAEL